LYYTADKQVDLRRVKAWAHSEDDLCPPACPPKRIAAQTSHLQVREEKQKIKVRAVKKVA
jgi:hypothetical protein